MGMARPGKPDRKQLVTRGLVHSIGATSAGLDAACSPAVRARSDGRDLKLELGRPEAHSNSLARSRLYEPWHFHPAWAVGKPKAPARAVCLPSAFGHRAAAATRSDHAVFGIGDEIAEILAPMVRPLVRTYLATCGGVWRGLEGIAPWQRCLAMGDVGKPTPTA